MHLLLLLPGWPRQYPRLAIVCGADAGRPLRGAGRRARCLTARARACPSAHFREGRGAVRGGLLLFLLAQALTELLEEALEVLRVRHAPVRLVAEQLAHRRGTKALVQQLEMLRPDERGVGDATRVRERIELAAKRYDVVRQPFRLVARADRAPQPAVLRRDPDRALAGVTDLRLEAADREHRLARHVDH